jgi:hypothetical protein
MPDEKEKEPGFCEEEGIPGHFTYDFLPRSLSIRSRQFNGCIVLFHYSLTYGWRWVHLVMVARGGCDGWSRDIQDGGELHRRRDTEI